MHSSPKPAHEAPSALVAPHTVAPRTVGRRRERFRLAAATALGLLLAGLGTLIELHGVRPVGPATAAEPEDDPSAPATSLEGNPYLVPAAAGAPELVAFLKAAPNKPAILQRRDVFQLAVIDAAERLAKLDSPAEDKRLAIRAKFAALATMREAGVDDAGKRLLDWAAEHKDSADPAIATDATLVFLEEKLKTADLANLEQLPALLDEIRAFLASQPDLDSRHLELASRTVSVINAIKDDPLAADAYTEFGKAFSKSKNRELSAYGAKLTKLGSKMSFLIKPLELEGDLVDGGKLDWASYRGKIVLIDFWATWCGPCVAEIPSVKTLYSAYHDKGFEIVGISLDDDAEELKKFLLENGMTWPQLHVDGGKHPMAEKYNVRAIPTMILVGKDGKVLKASARGPKLAEALKELFGPLPEGVVLPGEGGPAPAQPGAEKPEAEAKGDKI
ncbi:MAG TPA: thioredoxin-like domain-containing protein [Pirellulales bacterium]